MTKKFILADLVTPNGNNTKPSPASNNGTFTESQSQTLIWFLIAAIVIAITIIVILIIQKRTRNQKSQQNNPDATPPQLDREHLTQKEVQDAHDRKSDRDND